MLRAFVILMLCVNFQEEFVQGNSLFWGHFPEAGFKKTHFRECCQVECGFPTQNSNCRAGEDS